ncbi:gamma carbonic anhydrase family protein [Colwellia sp. M166]|jgi:carbonic anhydrase/acetyltransferase-like protein (isoleucine patch superfamily)|uniref:gamma carbonic anhydrase family protein n=1 Tax=Colwellia sp. M166 TaxID=2583805 RepID=UPI00211E52FD|nr:gamma carbonic anhydrase family protein [Colwellia sp. M166]UUO25212.1 gamma carbonic anhydrase family protein [Colwellia sp. M166]|tara:strand:+ start:50734 stop:51258 length:525 start_codon:yes stop_codon:yes gene_type:complete
MIYRLADTSPSLHDNNFIAPNATLIGDVVLSEHVSIWFNVVIRADMATVKIGENTNIQDGSILHVDTGFPMTIGRDVTVGHKVMLHGCTIGDNTLVGMNAVVLNGANIGKNCLIGANSLVTENMQVPDGHLVLGSPAKIIKALDDSTREMFTQSAKHYVENGQRYLNELTEVER